MTNMALLTFEHGRRYLCPLLVIALSAAATSGQNAARDAKVWQTPDSRSLLEVTLTTDRNSYTLKDVIIVQVLLTNLSKSPLYIRAPLDWGESASLSLWVKDAISGKEVVQDIIADALTPPPRSKDDFVKVLPDHIYGLVDRLPLADLSVRRSGRYKLVVEYHSPNHASMAFGLPIWSREMGRISSNEVTITVR
jgi:hypothetical protein